MSYEAMAVAQSMGARLQKAVNSAHEWADRAKALEAQNQELINRLTQREAHIAGLTAQLNAFKKVHPNSMLMQDSDKRFVNGQFKGLPKTQGRLIYEVAYDTASKKMGIANPLANRDN